MKKQEQIDQLRMRIERIESRLSEDHKDSNFSKLNLSEKPNSCEYEQPDFIPDWKDAPELAMWKAMDKSGWWYWYSEKPFILSNRPRFDEGESGDFITSGFCTNTDRIDPEYWKRSLMEVKR